MQGYLSNNEVYDPLSNTWASKAPMPTSRAGAAAGVLTGKVYVLGGGTGSGIFSTVEAYDPASNSWTTEPSMPGVRQFLAAGVVDNVLCAIGGDNNFIALPANEAFTPNTKPLAVARVPALVTSPNNASATVTLDGSASFDPDNDPLSYKWFVDGNQVATTAQASVTLNVGTHSIDLEVADGMCNDTDTVVVTVITASQAANNLSAQVSSANIAPAIKTQLKASVSAASTSFARGSTDAGINQLRAFQNKVRAQSGKAIPTAIANTLIAAAQKIIDAVGGG